MSRFGQPSDRPLAVLWVDGSNVKMVASPPEAATGVLAVTGAVFSDGFAVFPNEHLSLACDELDRCGFLWAVDRRFTFRSWADFMFAGLNPSLHRRVYDSLVEVLRDSDPAARVVLELAWRTFGKQS